MSNPTFFRRANWILLPLVCIASVSAFCYLNSRPSNTLQPLPQAQMQPAQAQPHQDSNQYASPELTPDVQLLNFVIRKGREGVPVLFAKYIF